MISAYALSLPVFSALERAPRVFDARAEVAGTAFLLGEGFFLTAGHVTDNISRANRRLVIGAPEPGVDLGVSLLETLDVERLGLDLSVVQVKTARSHIPANEEIAFHWAIGAAEILDPVWSVGYAHGMHLVRGQQRLVTRGFTGSVVSTFGDYEPPGYRGNSFAAVEVSFQAPPGLSGAPLLVGGSKVFSENRVVGVLVGNSATQIRAQRNVHTETADAAGIAIEAIVTMTVGLAIQVASILPLRSQLLGRTIGEYVESRSRLQ